MNIQMLGPFAASVGGQPLKLAGPKQRAVLSLLALRANHPVSVDVLVGGLWGDEPPASAPKMIQQYVSQLRRLLPADEDAEILTHANAYELRLEVERIDALRFEQLLHQAGREADGLRGVLARQALDLWLGAPLADLREEPFASSEARRLEELHLTATEVALGAELEAGHHADVVVSLRPLIDENPLRERLRALLMLALYRDGRQAEALSVFQDARMTLVEDLGLEPGPELRRLQEAILRQDPELELAVPDRAWASRETVQQVEAHAGALSRRREEVRDDERRLTDGVLDLQRLHEGSRRASPARCPFKGLEAFGAGDADLFFGRERLVAGIVAGLPGSTVLGVIGPSGSGKSSVVHAGLLPALGFGVLPGSDRWRTVVMRPGEAPADALRAALGAGGDAHDPLGAALRSTEPGARLVLVIDQFEESFTACRSAARRAEFFDALVKAAGDPRYLAILVLRADFYGACAAHPQLAALLGVNHVLVGPMRTDEVRQAIERPAERASLEVEPELVARLVEETAGRPGALPLLQTALLELWEQRVGNRLTLPAYEETGGINGAVARLAEDAFGSLTSAEAAAARNILLRLVGDAESGAAFRRRVALGELELDHNAVSRRVVELLTERRLLTLDDATVELAHEALLHEWPRLQGWLEEDANARRVHRHITLAAREWDAGGRDADELYRGARLSTALELLSGHRDALNALEQNFLDASRAAGEHQADRARRMNRRLRLGLAGALAGLLVAGVAGLAALDQRSDARRAATAADAQRLGTEALNDEQPDRALLLARAAVMLDDSPATRASLFATLLHTPAALVGVFGAGEHDAIQDVAVTASGDVAAFGDASGAVRLYQMPNRRHLGTYRLGRVHRLTFSPTGATLAVTGHDPPTRTLYPVVDLVDRASLRRRVRIALPPLPPTERVDAQVAFAPGEREILVLETSVGRRQPGALRRFDTRTGREIGSVVQVPADAIPELVLGTGGRRMTAPGGDTATAAALGPDAAVLALGTAEGAVSTVDLRSGRPRRFAAELRSPVVRLAYSRDGETLASSHEDGSITIWDARTGRPREQLLGHASRVAAVVMSRRAPLLLSGGDDGRALMWNLSDAERVVRSIPLGAPYDVGQGTPRGAAISPDGATLAVTQSDGTIGLFDARALQRRATLRVSEGPALGLAFSPDGRLLATSSDGGQVTLWDAASWTRVAELDGLSAWAEPLVFSPDGRRLASSAVHVDPSRIAMWDVRRRTALPLAGTDAATALAFSPDGRRLAAATSARVTDIRDAAGGRLLQRLRTSAPPRSVAFSPDGSLLFVGLLDGTGQFFSTRTWKPSGPAVRGQTRRLTSAGFTPDGLTLFTASADGSVMLWDVASRKPIGPPVVVEPDVPVTAVVGPGGASLYALPTGPQGLRLSISAAEWKRRACSIAGRELTTREWREALPRHDPRAVCAPAG